jgi:hypothetical protein
MKPTWNVTLPRGRNGKQTVRGRSKTRRIGKERMWPPAALVPRRRKGHIPEPVSHFDYPAWSFPKTFPFVSRAWILPSFLLSLSVLMPVLLRHTTTMRPCLVPSPTTMVSSEAAARLSHTIRVLQGKRLIRCILLPTSVGRKQTRLHILLCGHKNNYTSTNSLSKCYFAHGHLV